MNKYEITKTCRVYIEADDPIQAVNAAMEEEVEWETKTIMTRIVE